MNTERELRSELQRIDGRGYKAYKDIRGEYDFGDYTLYVDHVQGDPFATPSRLRVRVAQERAGFPEDTYRTKSREVALRDFLTRSFHQATRRLCHGNRGIGKSGLMEIDQPGQEILERTSIFVNAEFVEARFVLGLPAFGRRIAGRHAEAMLFEELPQIVKAALFFSSLDRKVIYEQVETAEDADSLRSQLVGMDLVAFVADGALLPRASGIDSRPLAREKAVPFTSPESLRVEIQLPNRGAITGMGIGQGITLIVGGGYHGKSTLLNALELGVYNHIPGDGREFVVVNPTAMKIRAEDGRRIEKVAIDPFINNLPFQEDTQSFCTENASGSTSQAANIIESIEAGAEVLLIDEDTSATNFMIRDHRMQELVVKEKEPITPFLDKARQLYRDLGISTILVIGGSGEYFDVADRVVCMVEYQPEEVTDQARAIAQKYRAERRAEGGDSFGEVIQRCPVAHSLDPSRGKKDVKIQSSSTRSISFGRSTIELDAVEQLVDVSQTRAIGDTLNYAKRYMDGRRTLAEILDCVSTDLEEKGLDIISPYPVGHYAAFRRLELAAAINRLRTLEVNQTGLRLPVDG
jgi:predicted ABC-class ATPase